MGNEIGHQLRSKRALVRIEHLYSCPAQGNWVHEVLEVDDIIRQKDLRTICREHTRTPPDKAEMASTTILKVKIVNGSGKIRTGGPGDEKKDTERQDLLDRVWTGVVPVWETVGEPVRGGDGRLADVPAHVQAFRGDTNKVNENYAKTAAETKT